MNDETQSVLAYEGTEAEVVFLRTLLDGSGIACWADVPLRGRYATREARLFVADSDVEAAAPLVADFREHGTKSVI